MTKVVTYNRAVFYTRTPSSALL